MADDHSVEISRSKIQGRMVSERIGVFVRVELTGHAIEQMAARGFSEADVFLTLRSPDQEWLPTQQGRKRVRRNKTARVACDVVYEELQDRLRVITVIRIDRRISGRKRK